VVTLKARTNPGSSVSSLASSSGREVKTDLHQLREIAISARALTRCSLFSLLTGVDVIVLISIHISSLIIDIPLRILASVVR